MKALLLLDFQNDFGAFGALAVPQAPAIVERARILLQNEEFALRIASQNWIPAHHPFFAANHYFRYPKQIVPIDGQAQRLWPLYGIQESFSADWMPNFPTKQCDLLLQKGLLPTLAPYSCFSEGASLDLATYLEEHAITELVLGGFLTEFSVRATALDALRLGYRVSVVKSLCGAANLDSLEDGALVLKELEAAGVQLLL